MAILTCVRTEEFLVSECVYLAANGLSLLDWHDWGGQGVAGVW